MSGRDRIGPGAATAPALALCAARGRANAPRSDRRFAQAAAAGSCSCGRVAHVAHTVRA
jgi:hypothetical protein